MPGGPMPRWPSRAALAALGLLACACSSPPAQPGAADGAAPDAALISPDAAGASDASLLGRDACAATDAGSAPDAEPVPSADASNALADAAVVEPDAATAPPDAGPASHCADTPTGRVSLPADDSGHSERMEWWYWTGHLKTASGRWFGFEECFFGTLALGIRGRMAHVALTDIEGDQFHYATALQPTTPLGAIPDGFDYSVPPQTAVGGNGHDVLHGEADGWKFDLTLDATAPPVFQHGDGYTDYSFGGYTYYYSRETMSAVGTLTQGGTTYPVTGSGWFDHQWGDIVSALNLGWDWFALELDDGRRMMIFIVRDNGAQVLVGGSYTDASCVTSEIAANAFQVTALGEWTSPRTMCTYPSGWTVVVNGETFTVTPAIQDQEVSSATPIYWEGASLVTGAATGRAYVELEGYCP